MRGNHSSPICLRCLFRLFIAFALLALCSLLFAYLFRGPILTTFTNIWVVDEEAIPADAVVVLGGGVNTRTFAAAEMYNQGLVKKVLIPDVLLEPSEKMGLKKSHTDECKEIVLGNGVPESAIELFGTQVSSTWEEIHAIKDWCSTNNPAVLLFPTEFPMSRRLNWVINQVLNDSGVAINVVPIDHFKYERESWWTNEYGLIDFQNEVIKYVFYRFKY